MSISSVKSKILPILRSQEVERASVFGSLSRGEDNKKSDVDLLVKLKKGQSLLDLIDLKFKLEEKLGKKVDLLTYNSIDPKLKSIILSEEKLIYEKR